MREFDMNPVYPVKSNRVRPIEPSSKSDLVAPEFPQRVPAFSPGLSIFSASVGIKRISALSPSDASRNVLQLQRLHGNLYVQRLFALAERATVKRDVVPGMESRSEQQEEGEQPESGSRVHLESQSTEAIRRKEHSGWMQQALAPPVQSEDDSATGDLQEEADAEQDTTVVREGFEPEEFEQRPDDDLQILQIGDFPEQNTDETVAAPQTEFLDVGRTGTGRYGDCEEQNVAPHPHAFTNGGRTGTVVWAGGGGAGAHGNEAAGSIQSQIAPTYQSQVNGATAEAWVRTGTGAVNVTRSWVGINGGNQGNGHFVTAAAATRINSHETLHVASTQGHYNNLLQPMLNRVKMYTPAPAGGNQKMNAPAEATAIAALQTFIGWATAISTFQTNDNNDNKPMGTVDTNDLATGTYPVDVGPGVVGGVNFQHRVRTPGEPNPT